MDPALYKQLKAFGEVKTNQPLAKFTTFRIGGPAQLFVTVEQTDKLVALLNFLTGEGVSYLILGGGSNLLLPDEGMDKVVIRVKTNELEVKSNVLTASAGVSFGFATALAVKNGLSGLEWSAGLPGTVGGAVRGNAGAAGGETGVVVKTIKAWIDGEEVEMNPQDCGFGYRESHFKHNGGVVLGCSFGLAPGDAKKSLLQMQEIVKRRNGHYPTYPSAGSFFKNVPLSSWPKGNPELPPAIVAGGKIPAGWLNDQTGLKGFQVGGAMVSKEHGNFLINFDGASQSDVLAVVEEVKSRVYNKFGVELEEEVCIVR